MVSDCGPLNRNGALYIGFLLLLVLIGFYDICVIVFLQLHHSKEICDRFFGLIEMNLEPHPTFDTTTITTRDHYLHQMAFAHHGVFGIESLMSLIEDIVANKVQLMHPSS